MVVFASSMLELFSPFGGVLLNISESADMPGDLREDGALLGDTGSETSVMTLG